MDPNRYYDLNTYYREIFGCRVQKISLDAGLSCPNRDGTISTGGCIFCNERGSGTGASAKHLSITAQLEEGKKRLRQRYKAQKFIAYFQSFSNTYAPIDTLSRLYREALTVEGVVGLSIGTRPDCVNEEVVSLLAGFTPNRLIWVEYGLQSVHDETLKRINRGHDFRCFEQAVHATQGKGIKICAHIILGLPGETTDQMLETAKVISLLGIDGVKLHLLYVIKGTPLEKEYREGRYRCLEQEEYIDIVRRFLEFLPPKMVIQRLTGDPHPGELVAPAWSLKKQETIAQLKAKMGEENSWQGKNFQMFPTRPEPAH
jgi:uncharacterized protein